MSQKHLKSRKIIEILQLDDTSTLLIQNIGNGIGDSGIY